MLSSYSPQYAAQPVKVKESLLINLTYQIGKIALTPAAKYLHTAARRTRREMFKGD